MLEYRALLFGHRRSNRSFVDRDRRACTRCRRRGVVGLVRELFAGMGDALETPAARRNSIRLQWPTAHREACFPGDVSNVSHRVRGTRLPANRSGRQPSHSCCVEAGRGGLRRCQRPLDDPAAARHLYVSRDRAGGGQRAPWHRLFSGALSRSSSGDIPHHWPMRGGMSLDCSRTRRAFPAEWAAAQKRLALQPRE